MLTYEYNQFWSTAVSSTFFISMDKAKHSNCIKQLSNKLTPSYYTDYLLIGILLHFIILKIKHI